MARHPGIPVVLVAPGPMKPPERELLAELDRVREHVEDDAELAALLRRIADRYDEAKRRTETGEATIRIKFHRGGHHEFRWHGDDRVMPSRAEGRR